MTMPSSSRATTSSSSSSPSIMWLPVSWTVGLMTIFLSITMFLGQNVPENYMDEPFHVPMTQLYCKGDFLSWDPKITTFPGLYVIGAAYAWISHLLLLWMGASLELTCSGAYLRSVNALLAVAIIQVAYAISMELQQRRALPPGSSNHHHQQQQQQQQQQQKFATSIALLVGTLPTQLFFAFLFYTDVPSLLFLLLTELLLLRHAPRTAAVAGAAAIGMRQTNAVWVTFLTGASILHDLLQSAPRERSQTGSSSEAVINTVTAGRGPQQGSKQQKGQQQQQQQQRPGPMAELWQLLDLAWQQFWQLFSEYCLLLLLPVVFCIFVVINGGITLGDKAAHAPTSHLMQPLYFGLFTLIGAWPLLLQPVVLTRLRNAISSAPVLSAAVIAAAAALAVGFVAKYTLVHPYLLADNRHYTFYIWRKVFAKHWLPRYCLTPGYVLAWLLLLAALSATQHWLWVAAFVMSCWVTLVPAWLVEFRYFTTPFVLAVLHLPAPKHPTALWLVIASYCCVNVLTLWMFTQCPYTWSDGSVARFMW